MRRIIKKDCYLYTMKNGKIIIKFGDLVGSHESYCYGFAANTGVQYKVGLEEGVAYNQNLWLSERDDKKACEGFKKYERDTIANLYSEIDTHEAKLAWLEGAQING